MTYYSLILILRKEDMGLQNWKKPIDIASSLSSDIQSEKWNFNRFNGTIEVRFDIPEEKMNKLEKIGNEMKERDEIENYKVGKWSQPDFIQISHYVSSECAVKFSEEVARDPELSEALFIEKIISTEQEDQNKLFSFYYCLVHSFLKLLNFDPELIWEYKRKSLIDFERVMEIAKNCIDEKMRKEVNKIDKEDMPSFCERFVHLFFNCIGWQKVPLEKKEGEIQIVDVESNVRNMLYLSVMWSYLSNSLNEN